jgi:hypothetical protein
MDQLTSAVAPTFFADHVVFLAGPPSVDPPEPRSKLSASARRTRDAWIAWRHAQTALARCNAAWKEFRDWDALKTEPIPGIPDLRRIPQGSDEHVEWLAFDRLSCGLCVRMIEDEERLRASIRAQRRAQRKPAKYDWRARKARRTAREDRRVLPGPIARVAGRDPSHPATADRASTAFTA